MATVEQISWVRLLRTSSISWLTVPNMVFITHEWNNATDKRSFLTFYLFVAGINFSTMI